MQTQDETLSEIIKLKLECNDHPDKQMYAEADHTTLCLYHQWSYLEIHSDLLYRKWIPINPDEQEHMQIVVPITLRKEILHLLHTHKTGGHLGIQKVLGKLRQKFYWPGHKADIERFCRDCAVCQATNPSSNPKKAPLQQKPIYRRFAKISLDICGPFESSSKNSNTFILVVADAVSKWTEAFAIPDMTAHTVADVLSSQWFAKYGVASSIHSDQGKCFESRLFQELCKIWETRKTRTARYRPNSNGGIERTNRTLKKMLRCFAHEHPESWEDTLPYLMMAYRSVRHSSTNCTPALLTFGSELQLPADLLYSETALQEIPPSCPQELVDWIQEAIRRSFKVAKKHLKASAQRQKRNYDKNTCWRSLDVGQWVMVLYPPQLQLKLGQGWRGPQLIVQKLGDVNYVVQADRCARKVTLHIDHLKLYRGDDVPDSWLPTTIPAEGHQEVETQTE